MNRAVNDLLMVPVIAGVTILLRFLPFIVFSGKRKVPKIVEQLGNLLPCAVMGMLVVYCLRNTDIFASSHGLPELISTALVVISYAWKRNTLLSVFFGTVCYMLLIQLVF